MVLNGRPLRVILPVNVKFSVEEPLALPTQQSFEGSSTQAVLVHSRHNLVNISAVYEEFHNSNQCLLRWALLAQNKHFTTSN